MTRIGNSVLYLPPAHPIIAAYEALMAGDVLFSDGLFPYHRLIGRVRRTVGRGPFVPANIRIGLYGPATLTWLAARHRALRFAAERKSFYRIHARPRLFFGTTDFRAIVADSGIIGLHISPKDRDDEAPAPGSLYEWLERNLDPPPRPSSSPGL
jgi:hypothetical protein